LALFASLSAAPQSAVAVAVSITDPTKAVLAASTPPLLHAYPLRKAYS
jgi:hypothetical protein